MKLKKILTVEAETTDGKKMIDGCDYVIVLSDRSLCGTYRGISRRGALMFDVPVKCTDIRFNIMPSGINEIYEAEIDIKDDTPDSEDGGSPDAD